MYRQIAHEDPTALVGKLLENFAIGEVARQFTWAEEPVQLFHYRDRDQVEVDMVLEHADGTVIGIEVKAADTIRGEGESSSTPENSNSLLGTG